MIASMRACQRAEDGAHTGFKVQSHMICLSTSGDKPSSQALGRKSTTSTDLFPSDIFALCVLLSAEKMLFLPLSMFLHPEDVNCFMLKVVCWFFAEPSQKGASVMFVVEKHSAQQHIAHNKLLSQTRIFLIHMSAGDVFVC